MKAHAPKSLSPVVHAIGQLHRQGDIIPYAWFQQPKLRFAGGKPNLVAMHVLANILYWYTPTIVRDEASQQILEVKAKFRADKLQVSYKRMAEYFGFSKRQVADAVYFLLEAGLITRELRDISSQLGTLANCVFLEPVVEAIMAINEVVGLPKEYDSEDDFPAEDEGGEGNITHIAPDNVIPRSAEGHTPQRNTPNTAAYDISSESSSVFSSPSRVAAPPSHADRQDRRSGAALSREEGQSITPQPPATIDPQHNLEPQRSLRSQAESKRAAGGVAARHGELGLPESVKQWYDANGQYIGPNYACPVL